MRLVVGIDTGLTGAYAVLEEGGRFIAAEQLPVVRDGSAAWIDAGLLSNELLRFSAPHEVVAFIERTHAMPKNGSVAAFSQGMTLGSTLAAIQTLDASIRLITPLTWKRALGLGKDKSASLDKARLLFPRAKLDRQKDHNLAEAILIAHYGTTQLRSEAA